MTNPIQPIKEGRIFYEGYNCKSVCLHSWHLTQMEWDVVEAVCAGCETRAELRQRFYVARGTINTHLTRIFRKLNVYSLAGVVVKVLGDPQARERCFPHLQITEKP